MLAIETERLVLRDFVEEDWRAVHRYASDLDVMRFIIYRANSEEETRGFIRTALEQAQSEARERYEFAIVLREGPEAGELIGGCGIGSGNLEWEAEFGYCLNPGYWGRGYGTEAAGALLRFGFEVLGMHRIYARCNAANEGSARVLEKCGLRREARLRERIRGFDQWWDELVFAMLDHEWAARDPMP